MRSPNKRRPQAGVRGPRGHGLRIIPAETISGWKCCASPYAPFLALRTMHQLLFIDKADKAIWLAPDKAKPFSDSRSVRSAASICGRALDWVRHGGSWPQQSWMTQSPFRPGVFAGANSVDGTLHLASMAPMSADVDFTPRRIDNPAKLISSDQTAAHREEPGPDLSFLRVEITSGNSKLAYADQLAANVAVTRTSRLFG